MDSMSPRRDGPACVWEPVQGGAAVHTATAKWGLGGPGSLLWRLRGPWRAGAPLFGADVTDVPWYGLERPQSWGRMLLVKPYGLDPPVRGASVNEPAALRV